MLWFSQEGPQIDVPADPTTSKTLLTAMLIWFCQLVNFHLYDTESFQGTEPDIDHRRKHRLRPGLRCSWRSCENRGRVAGLTHTGPAHRAPVTIVGASRPLHPSCLTTLQGHCNSLRYLAMPAILSQHTKGHYNTHPRYWPQNYVSTWSGDGGATKSKPHHDPWFKQSHPCLLSKRTTRRLQVGSPLHSLLCSGIPGTRYSSCFCSFW
jgi:hypothetical protein